MPAGPGAALTAPAGDAVTAADANLVWQEENVSMVTPLHAAPCVASIICDSLIVY